MDNNSFKKLGTNLASLVTWFIRNNNNQAVNLAEARSRREDADFAALSSQRASADILQQAQISIQGQANVNRSQALNLLS